MAENAPSLEIINDEILLFIKSGDVTNAIHRLRKAIRNDNFEPCPITIKKLKERCIELGEEGKAHIVASEFQHKGLTELEQHVCRICNLQRQLKRLHKQTGALKRLRE